jgi:hypothetical protein
MRPKWWLVKPDPDGDGWLVTDGKRSIRFPPGRDLEALAEANKRNGVTE